MNWNCLYRNDRVHRVRFVQLACLLFGLLCIYLLKLAIEELHVSQSERWLVIAMCVAAIVLPNIGMIFYVRCYIFSFEVADDQARITLLAVFGGRRSVTLERKAFLAGRAIDGHVGVAGMSVIGYAPSQWLLTNQGRFILDEQSPGAEAVNRWLTGKGEHAAKIIK